MICDGCGSNDFEKSEEGFICKYCRTRYTVKIREATINLDGDVERLLKKMVDEPLKVRRYADLILDIDPTNTDIYKYL